MKHSPQLVGTSLILISSFFYASYGIWTKLMGSFFDGYTASALRSILVVIFLGSLAIYHKKLKPVNMQKNRRYIIGMFVSSTLTWGPYYYAVLHAGVGISLAINYICIVLGMVVFGVIFSQEKLTKEKIASLLLGMIGIALIFSPSLSGHTWIALSGAVIAGVASAAGVVFAKKLDTNSTQSTLIWWSTSVFANLLMATLLSKPFPTFDFQIEWFYLVILALSSVVSSWTLVRGLKYIDTGVAGILGLFEILFGVLFGVVLFSEKPDGIALIGMAVVLVAASLPYFKLLLAKRALTK